MIEARFRSWWKKIKQRRVDVAVATIIIVAAIVLIIIGYSFDVAGFNGYTQVSTIRTLSGPTAGTVTRTEAYQPGKTLWNWLQLAIIPVALAIAGFWLNRIQKDRDQKAEEAQKQREEGAAKEREKLERESRKDNQHEAALQAYIDKMSELLLHEKIREPVFEPVLHFDARNEAQHIARAKTLTVLSKLDASRKRSVIQFLHESDLISKSDPSSKTECIVHLHATDLNGLNGADLSGADLSGLPLGFSDLHKVNLKKANLSKAILSETDLSGAVLSEANLREARLSWGKYVIGPTGANLKRAVLREADLSSAIMNDVILIEADLSGAKLSDADLSGANLKDATGITIEELEKQAKSLKGATMPDGSIRP